MWMFACAVSAVLILLTMQGWMTGDWTGAARDAADLIKSVILPIVTLILGYYFRQSERR